MTAIMRFVIPVVFYEITNIQCVYWSDTTLFIGKTKYLLHKGQLHVSALDNGHLQVAHEILIKQLYKTYMGCLYGVGSG